MNKKTTQVENTKIAYFEYPTNKPVKSIVLFCHGFPGSYRLTTMATPLNKHGITLEEINYRGDKESEGTFSFFGSIKDIEVLTLHLKQQYPTVPLTVLGYSAGGFYACCLIREQPNLFDKIILLNPLLDVSFTRTPTMEELWKDARQSIRLNDMDFYGAEIDKMNNEFNPITFVKELTPKINIVQSANDDLLPTETVQSFYNNLQNPGDLAWIPDAGHGLRGDEPELINALVT